MEFEVTSLDDTVQVSVKGEVDLFYSPKLRELIINELTQGYGVTVELSQVTYIDSSGIASLVEAYQFAKTNKLHFNLLNTSTPVMQVLKLARLDKVIPHSENANNEAQNHSSN